MLQNIKEMDLKIIAELRKNARMSLTKMSKKTQVPVSTIHDRLKQYKESLVKKYTSLLDFAALGYHTRAHILFKMKNETRDDLKEFLAKHQNVNSIYKINNGYDYLVDAVFKSIKEMEEFLEIMESKYAIKSKEVYYIIDELKREEFFSEPEKMCMLQ